MITGETLKKLGKEIISEAEPHIGPASIDVRIGGQLKVGSQYSRVDIGEDGKSVYNGFYDYELDLGDVLTLHKGNFYIAHSVEYVTLPPDVGALLFLRSSAGRRGLDHLHAGFLEPGWHGQITFELQPAVTTQIEIGSRIAQMVLFRTTDEAFYNGVYNGQRGATVAPQ